MSDLPPVFYEMLPVLIGLVVIGILFFIWDFLVPKPKRKYGIHKHNPYFYVDGNSGAMGIDFEKMLREDPEYFDKHYLSQVRDFQKYFEARGHKFINGRIEPPIVLHD